MRNTFYKGAALLALAAFVFISVSCRESAAGPVREPAVAGAFYPGDKTLLTKTVDAFMQSAAATPVSSQSGRLVALVSPHAGYVYSGGVAAAGYKAIEGRSYKTVILVGPAHRASLAGASVYTEGSFRTPLGDVAIDEGMARSFLNPQASVVFNPQAYDGEHSLEVQLPFLQRALKGGFRIVPVLIGQPAQGTYDHLADVIGRAAQDGDVLIVASTDLSHYHGYDKAVIMDTAMTDAVCRLSDSAMRQLLSQGSGEMCGGWPVLVTVEAARRVGANRTVLFERRNSGDVTPDRSRVVGYASIGIYADPLGRADELEILSLARKAIEEAVTKGTLTMPRVENPRLLSDGAVFVTINRGGRLRGCIGAIRAREPLYMSVVNNAYAAALHDPRFPPMNARELEDMEIEVSILSHMSPAPSPGDIVVGTHGVYMTHGMSSAVFLPQVPVEQGWGRETYLDELAQKAGLRPGAWRDQAARLYTFTARVIHQ